jgi:hypothetical protein
MASLDQSLSDADMWSGHPHTMAESTWAWGPKGIYEQKHYTDLQVRSADIYQIVSAAAVAKPKAGAVERDVWLQEAIWRVANGNWDGDRSAWAQSQSADVRITDAKRAVEQAAIDGKLRTWGADSPSGRLIEIDHKYWETHQIYILSFFHENPEQMYTELSNHDVLDRRYRLMTSRKQVEELWP